VTTCSLVYQYRRFSITCCLHLEGISVNWNTEQAGPSEKFALIYRTARRYLPEHLVRYDICCHDHVKTYAYQKQSQSWSDKPCMLLLVVFFYGGVVLKQHGVHRCPWEDSKFLVVLFIPSFPLYLLQQKHCCQNGLNVREQVNLSIGRGRVGRRTLNEEKWYHRMLHTAVFSAGTNTL
jgi:hypothetical protein